MTNSDRLFISECIGQIVRTMMKQDRDGNLTPGEIYDAIAAELERRCSTALEAARGKGI